MKKILVILVILLLLILFVGNASAHTSSLDNTKEWNDITKTITIKDNKSVDLMTVQLISSEPNLCTFTEIFDVTNFKTFTPKVETDFKGRTVKHVGTCDVLYVEWFIQQNVSYIVNITDYKVVKVKKEIYNNKTGKNEIILVNETVIAGYHKETRYKNEWYDYKPYEKTVSKNSVQRIKVVYHKPPELGNVSIQTIPIFRGVECTELTWWNTSWTNKREIKINNTGGSDLIYYQINVDLTDVPINSTSLRIVNETAGSTVSHWQETILSGNCTKLWVNITSIPASSWLNETYYIYYENEEVTSDCDIANTFIFGDGFDSLTAWSTVSGTPTVSGGELTLNSGDGVYRDVTFPSLYCVHGLIKDADSNTDSARFSLGITNLHTTFGPNIGWRIGGGIYEYSAGWTSFGSYTSNVYNIIEMRNVNPTAHTWDAVVDNVVGITGAGFSNSVTPSRIILTGSSVNCYADWIFVRKYTSNPPTITLGSEEIVSSNITISLHSKSPEILFTNYTGLLSASYIVESNFPVNMSSLAFLIGMNYTLTSDYHSYLKVPGNSIANDGIYRAHNRNTTPYLSWEGNGTITEGNVWKWSGGEYGDFWITNTSINNTHTWINMTGVASNVFSSMFYLGRSAMYESEKTGIEINKAQGVIFKIWDLEQFRGRSYNYYLSLYFDSQIESTPNENIEIWYCNDSFDPLTDDPCLVCDYKDTWTSDRWMDHEAWQPHSNVSYAKPLQVHAGTATCPSSPTEVNYIYLKSDTVSSKSYILNATNSDPGICNLTYAQTETMWLRNEISGTNTPHAYTPSFFNTFVRDYQEFTHHMYLANDQGVWGHSDYTTHPIGISNLNPTFCKYNYFWWNGTTDYNMNGSYTEDFYINLTYGFDPDNGAALTHVLSLYDDDYNFVTFVNSSLVGNQTDADVFFSIKEHLTFYQGYDYRFKIVSTDNEGSTSVSWSNLFSIQAESTYTNVATVIRAFPATLQHTLTSLLSYIPLLIGGLITGVLIILVMNIFGKLKRW